MNKRIVLITFLLVSTITQAQNSIDIALSAIRTNNKTLVVSKQYVEAKGLELNTGRTLENPTVNAEYLWGNTSQAGDQLEFSVTQGFDFPTVYGNKKKLADNQVKLLELKQLEIEQNILLEAKQYCIKLIYLNRLLTILKKREKRSHDIFKTFSNQYENGLINIVELNKSKIQLLAFKAAIRKAESDHKMVLGKLKEFNGGQDLVLTDTLYPNSVLLPSFEEIHDSIEFNDPGLKWIGQQSVVFDRQLNLSKSQSFPSLELGYKYQSVLGQEFNGITFGMSIPMWQQKNTLKTQKANIELGKYQIQEHRVEHFLHIKHLYEQYENIKGSIAEYEEVVNSISTEEILYQSFLLGDINFITYAQELEYFYNAQDNLMELEQELQIIVAELQKYKL